MKRLKHFFNNRPWKDVKTRKVTLVMSVILIVIYTIVGIVMGFFDHELDSTLTEEVFGFFKWLITTGCAITVAKVVKGKTNTDLDEHEIFSSSEDDTTSETNEEGAE